MRTLSLLIFAVLAIVAAPVADAASGPIGIDHRLPYDNHGIFKRQTQLDLMYLMVGTDVAGGLWLGNGNRLGHTFWQSVDATAMGAVSSFTLKRVFQRSRPSQTDNPNQWGQGCCNHLSFPSGEVTAVSAMVTPFILEYHDDYPWVWALETLPAYDAVARMKTWGHWQTDVLAGFALGTALGYYAHTRKTPLVVSILPDGLMVGFRAEF